MYGLTDDIKTWTPEAGFQDRKEPYFVTHGVNMMEVRTCVRGFAGHGCWDGGLIGSIGTRVRVHTCGCVTSNATQLKQPQPSNHPQLHHIPQVMACPDVDFTRTTCNDLIEIFEALGIEAARAGMLNEIRSVLFFDGGYINYRHMSILVDVMTFRGALTAVSRHGINRGEQVGIVRTVVVWCGRGWDWKGS